MLDKTLNLLNKILNFVLSNIFSLYAAILLAFLLLGFFSNTTLKIIIWPSLAAIFIVAFKDQLSNLLNLIVRVKLPGGVELLLKQEITAQMDTAEKIIKESNIISQKEDEPRVDNISSDELYKHIEIQNIIIKFERIFNLIMQSQIDLLWQFQANKECGLNKLQVEAYYASLKSHSLLAQSWTWQDYIQFLIKQDLIYINDKTGSFLITEVGLAFLNYIASMNYQKYPLM